MRKIFVIIIPSLLLSSCFEKTSQKKIKAENLILNQCEFVISTTEKHLVKEIPSSSFVFSCGCISEIISQQLAEDASIEGLEEMEKTPFELTKEIERYVRKKKETIKKTCIERSKD